MKFYIVRSTATTTREFVVQAESNLDAVTALLTTDNKNIRQTGHDTLNSTEVSESHLAAWVLAAEHE